MTNGDLYLAVEQLNGLFENESQHFPAKVNFYLMKNVTNCYHYAQDLDRERKRIIETYGHINEDGSGQIEKSNLKTATNELHELLNLECTVELHKIPLSWLDGLHFTPRQMQALLFMIEED